MSVGSVPRAIKPRAIFTMRDGGGSHEVIHPRKAVHAPLDNTYSCEKRKFPFPFFFAKSSTSRSGGGEREWGMDDFKIAMNAAMKISLPSIAFLPLLPRLFDYFPLPFK